ncbi:hypothetical protein CLTEP_19800 [Clostridium tepidiprofundi DSM 19306]|uniref:Type I-B CRISPR-associated protein Cas7/Cst2/DevR n=1 Tax=Clostridium tepidiprofundi DSM 19306 TaxID=1121338 RepID=A0A151B2R3_9CLOT|nr:type I-B CRISPR-associated protein Cas7/Cst2/DevR [Clostridium tepidiprofundi]KYH34080.1 hypothetical protein CLTEP_19800 [Clostridium tepidiprofundi DSM 19306]
MDEKIKQKVVKSVTVTILTESSVALSNDQGFGNYTPIKKCYMSDGPHAITSVGTMTYEIRKQLGERGWNLSGIILNTNKKGKVTNIYPCIDNIECSEENGLETDVFGFLVPDKQLSKTSPLRIIPPKSVHIYKNDTQLITNKGFLNKDFRRNYYTKENEKYPEDKFPQTQALASEEIFGDYYVYTITIELDRLGVLEVKDGKYLAPDERIYMDKKLREKALRDILDVIVNLTRTIKHQTVHLKPLAVFGGAFESVIPYFWNDIEMDKHNVLILDNVLETIESYNLDKDNYIAVYSGRMNTGFRNAKIYDEENKILEGYPAKLLRELGEKLFVGEDDKWYLKVGEGDTPNDKDK